MELIRECALKAAVHISNGLLPDVQRIMPAEFEVMLDFGDLQIPEVFAWLAGSLNLAADSMLQNLNCGIGMVLVIPQSYTTWKSVLKDAKVLGVLKRKHSAHAAQIQVRNFEENLSKIAKQYGGLGSQILNEPQHHALQLELSSQALQRKEAFMTQMGHRLTRLPEGYKDPILVMGTDGVGTKIKIAQETQRNSTVGIDLVAMCVNDILCNGAESLTFSSYYACGELKKSIALAITEGVAEGSRQAGASLIGKSQYA